jgi:hypothetical protein
MVNEVIIESDGDKRIYILEGELVRHSYIMLEPWGGLNDFNDIVPLKTMRWWWRETAAQPKVSLEEGDARLAYKEFYLTKVLLLTEFEKLKENGNSYLCQRE